MEAGGVCLFKLVSLIQSPLFQNSSSPCENQFSSSHPPAQNSPFLRGQRLNSQVWLQGSPLQSFSSLLSSLLIYPSKGIPYLPSPLPQTSLPLFCSYSFFLGGQFLWLTMECMLDESRDNACLVYCCILLELVTQQCLPWLVLNQELTEYFQASGSQIQSTPLGPWLPTAQISGKRGQEGLYLIPTMVALLSLFIPV